MTTEMHCLCAPFYQQEKTLSKINKHSMLEIIVGVVIYAIHQFPSPQNKSQDVFWAHCSGAANHKDVDASVILSLASLPWLV